MTKNWRLFAGFKYGKTRMTFIPRDIDEEIEDTEQDTLDVGLTNESYT